MITKKFFFTLTFVFLNQTSALAASSPQCDEATDILFEAYHLYQKNQAVSLQKLLFAKSLKLCPDRPYVQTTFASILKDEGQYNQAAYHYQQAIRYDKQSYQARYGLGETYYKQKRWPLSLEAHASACQQRQASKARIEQLLAKDRYLMSKKNEFIDRDSLLVFYHPQRRENLNQRLADCDFSHQVRPIYTFINFEFLHGEATVSRQDPEQFELTISQADNRQFDEIAAALKQLNSPIITIYGHSDSRNFNNPPPRSNHKSLNQRLSEQRAMVVAEALVQRGIKHEINTIGLSNKRLLYPYASQLLSNRRVEIQVEYPVESEEEESEK